MDRHVAAIRQFNRFYTARIGVLEQGHLDSPFSLTQVRVLYELAHHDELTASDLVRDLDLDAGYLSRMLRGFEQQGLVTRTASPKDGRRSHLRLTARGRRTFDGLDRKASARIGDLLSGVPAEQRKSVVSAMETITSSLSSPSALRPSSEPFTLRSHQPGDMGWIIHRHGALYWLEYGWDERFEALVAKICADFIENFDGKRERCWIAERGGQFLGCVFCVAGSKTVARLRLLLVEPTARGLGLGRRLVEECVAFARKAGYRKVTLWTQGNLTAARHIYASVGFVKTRQETNDAFGHRLVSETWDLTL